MKNIKSNIAILVLLCVVQSSFATAKTKGRTENEYNSSRKTPYEIYKKTNAGSRDEKVMVTIKKIEGNLIIVDGFNKNRFIKINNDVEVVNMAKEAIDINSIVLPCEAYVHLGVDGISQEMFVSYIQYIRLAEDAYEEKMY